MDYNDYLLKFTWLPIGRYNFYDKTVNRERLRVVVNRIFVIINIFCGIKGLYIVLSPNPKTIFYLSELYIMDNNIQKSFHVGLSALHFLTGYMYYYWAKMDATSLECLNHLFIPDFKNFCKYYYGLDPMLAKEFLHKAKRIKSLININVVCFQIAFVTVLIRCCAISGITLGLNSFFFISLPFFVVTLISYQCLIWAFLSIFILMFTTMEFLILRTKDLSKKIKILVRLVDNRTNQGKRERKVREIIKIINSFILQYKNANSIFDDLISYIYVNVLVSAFVFPSFIFIVPSINTKILIGVFYFIGVFGSVIFITVFNDQFITKVG